MYEYYNISICTVLYRHKIGYSYPGFFPHLVYPQRQTELQRESVDFISLGIHALGSEKS